MGMKSFCTKEGCKEDVFKQCKFCKKDVCVEHLLCHKHECIANYEKFIRKTQIRKYGQDIVNGRYVVICNTCGYRSEFPSLIKNAGKELEDHLKNNPSCLTKKKTYLNEFVVESIPKGIKESVQMSSKKFICSCCSPAKEFSNDDEFMSHNPTK